MTVYIVGAGMSAASSWNLPVTTGFFEAASLLDSQLDSSGRGVNFERLVEFLINQNFYGFFGYMAEPPKERLRQTLPQLNVEEVFVHLDNILAWSSSASRLYGELLEARAELTDYISLRLACKDRQLHCLIYHSFLEILKPEDVIINFNWDCLIEKHILQNDQKCDVDKFIQNQEQLLGRQPFDFYQRKTPVNLKLHGCLSWFFCVSDSCPSFRRVGTSFRELGFQAHTPEIKDADLFINPSGERLCLSCGREMIRGIIPPVAGKRWHMPPVVEFQWQLALRALREDPDWVFLGYSLPELDTEARSLFRAATSPSTRTLSWGSSEQISVTIVDINPDPIEQRIRPLLPGNEHLLQAIKKHESVSKFLSERRKIPEGKGLAQPSEA